MLVMENIKMHVFKHPKYYTELRKRNKSDQVISETKPTGDGERAPGPGLELSSVKLQAPSFDNVKRQASSPKQQASSAKPEASSSMIREPRNI